MKKVVLLLSFAASLGACSKKNDAAPVDPQTTLLTAKSWRESAATSTTVINGVSTTEDDYATKSPCRRDDFVKFSSDNTYIGDEGPTKCSPTTPQTLAGKWSFNADRTQLTLADPANASVSKTFTLVELSATTLHLRESATTAGAGVTVSVTSDTILKAF